MELQPLALPVFRALETHFRAALVTGVVQAVGHKLGTKIHTDACGSLKHSTQETGICDFIIEKNLKTSWY